MEQQRFEETADETAIERLPQLAETPLEAATELQAAEHALRSHGVTPRQIHTEVRRARQH